MDGRSTPTSQPRLGGQPIPPPPTGYNGPSRPTTHPGFNGPFPAPWRPGLDVRPLPTSQPWFNRRSSPASQPAPGFRGPSMPTWRPGIEGPSSSTWHSGFCIPWQPECGGQSAPIWRPGFDGRFIPISQPGFDGPSTPTFRPGFDGRSMPPVWRSPFDDRSICDGSDLGGQFDGGCKPSNLKRESNGRRVKPKIQGCDSVDGRLDESRFLPYEIWRKILLFVPPRYILNLRSVCKSWLHTINDPAFFAKHKKRTLNSHLSTSPLLILPSKTSVAELFLFDCLSRTSKKMGIYEYLGKDGGPFHCHELTILSINGLLLLYVEGSLGRSDDSFRVFNPFTREIFHLPDPPPFLCNDFLCDKTRVGFTADPVTGKYNVVRLVRSATPEGGVISRCDIFTQGSLSWNEAACSPPPVKLLSQNPVFLNGVLYWRVYMDLSILSFDVNGVGNDQFALLPLPPPIANRLTWFTRIEVLEENLCIVECGGSNTVDIWKLNEREENEWSKWYSVEIQIPELRGWGYVRVVAIEKGKIWLVTKTEVFTYDPKTQTLVKLGSESNMEKGTSMEEETSSSFDFIMYRRLTSATSFLDCSLYTETMVSTS